jgi:hypothetical protein
MPEVSEADTKIRQHIYWLRLFANEMSESNWRDMRLQIQRQLDRLTKELCPKE